MDKPLSDLRDKYPHHPSIKYKPNADCPYCKGSGEATAKAGLRPCICVYVGNRKIANLAQKALNRMARDFRESCVD